MEFSSNRQWCSQHFISKYLDCVVVSFLEYILMTFNIVVIKQTKFFLKVNNSIPFVPYLFSLCRQIHLFYILLASCCQIDVLLWPMRGRYSQSIGLILSFCCCCFVCERLKIRKSALVSPSVLRARLLPTVTTADRQNRKPVHNEKVCLPFNNYYFLTLYYILNGAEESLL